ESELPAAVEPTRLKANALLETRSDTSGGLPMTAAERARRRRLAGKTIGGLIAYGWGELSPRARLLTACATGLLLIAAVVSTVRVLMPAKTGPVVPEAETRSPQKIEASFGLGDGVT